MDLYKGRLALVTGASSGIGASISEALVKYGINVIGAARRLDKLEALKESLKGEKGKFTPIKCDLSKEEEICKMFTHIDKNLGGIDICINNAAYLCETSLKESSWTEWMDTYNINLFGLVKCTQLAISSMKSKGADDGYIINIGSTAGHEMYPHSKIHMYGTSKFAVRAFTQGIRMELKEEKSKIRVSLISPGLVATAMTESFKDAPIEPMLPEDIATIALQMLTTHPRVEIEDVIVKPAVINQ